MHTNNKQTASSRSVPFSSTTSRSTYKASICFWLNPARRMNWKKCVRNAIRHPLVTFGNLSKRLNQTGEHRHVDTLYTDKPLSLIDCTIFNRSVPRLERTSNDCIIMIASERSSWLSAWLCFVQRHNKQAKKHQLIRTSKIKSYLECSHKESK